MPDILIILLIVNILVLIYFLVFSDKSLKNTYIITVFLVVFITFGLYEYYAIKELFN